MSIIYSFTSLNALADHCLMVAHRLRETEPRGRNKKDRELLRVSDRSEARAWESIADMLRNTVIEPRDDLHGVTVNLNPKQDGMDPSIHPKKPF